ncbi:MAG: helix-turn-helix transcriptional regulator [Gemmatimonadetes bacterium]|nr:helix-turn-helix transcriptional regulator [Gemmatimonadota bacterium]
MVVLSLQWRRTSTELQGARRPAGAQRGRGGGGGGERGGGGRSAEGGQLGVAIDRQFAAWGLTPTEGEVALLLLKGYGHKQIAGSTGRSERTVRQHAVAVYQKAGLAGRAELAAFFLHDLMLPGERGKGP